MRASGRYILALACLATAPGWATGQVRILQYGQALDANPLVGSGGQNITRYSPPLIDSQLYVNRQVTGLAGFRGSVAYVPAGQLDLVLPSAALEAFRRESVGLGDVVAGSPYTISPYYSQSSTILGMRDIVAGQALPGTNVPASAIPPSPTGLYGQGGTTVYSPLGLSSWDGSGRLSLAPPSGTVATQGGQGQWPTRDRAAVANLFAVPGTAQREQLARELSRVPLPGSLVAETDPNAQLERRLVEERIAKLKPVGLTPEPNEPNVGPAVARWRLRPPGGTGQAPWQPGQDVYSDILARLSRGAANENLTPLAEQETRRQWQEFNAAALEQGTREMGEEEAPARPALMEIDRQALLTQTAAPGSVVEFTSQGKLLIHGLAGAGRDEFNMLMSAAEAKLKEGKYYEAAEAYRAAIATDQGNPLARVGLGVALFAAGEPLGAAYQLKRAAEMFPPVLTSHLDLPSMVDADLLGRRLDFLAKRMESPNMAPEPMLYFIAAYVYGNLGQGDQARAFAARLRDMAPEEKMLADYAQWVLEGRMPSSAPAASQPASAPASAD